MGAPPPNPRLRAPDVVTLCPFPAGVILWEAQPDQLSLTVIVKATFALVPGEAVVAPEQDPLREESHWDDNGLASLHGPGDFAPSKRRVDVTLVGHAYAPRGEPATSIVARLAVGDLVKAVRVTGDRAWTTGAGKLPEPGPPAPFLRMPLRYERAALSADDPIGIDANAPPVPAMPALPNLERAEDAPRGEATACFGPVAPTWRARRRLLDEAATFWAYGIAHDPRAQSSEHGPLLGPAPPRFDFAFFNAAPADQQIDLLRPGTPLSLLHLHPCHELLETRLPAIRPQVFRVPPPGTPRARIEEIALRCDSLWIDTDRAVAVLTWRGVTDVGPRAEGVGRIVVAADLQGKKLHWELIAKRLGDRALPTVRLGPDGLPPPEEPDEGPPPDPLALRHDTVKSQRPVEMGEPPRPPAAIAPALPDAPTDAGLWDADTHATAQGPDDDVTLAPAGTMVAPPGTAPRSIPRPPEPTPPPAASKPVDDGGRAPKPPAVAVPRPIGGRPAVEVDVATYARLQVSIERGEVGRALEDLELSLNDLVRLQSAWARRLAASPRLAAELARAVEAARAQG